MPQGAYDSDRPNGTSRRENGDRVVAIFRLYRRISAPGLGDAPADNSPLAKYLNPIRQGIRTARNFIRQEMGALQGRILEKEYRFVLIPERIDQQTDVRTHFSYTQGGYFIDTPLANGRGVTHFRLAGRTHWTPVYVNGVPVDGDSALKEFQELVDDYFFPRDGAKTSDFELVWMNLLAPVSAEDPFGEFEWTIHPLRNGVSFFQTAQRPFSRFFSFDFAGLQSNRDRAKGEDGFWASLTQRSYLGKLLDTLHLTEVKDAITAVYGTVQEVNDLLNDVGNVVTAVSDYVVGFEQFIVGGIGLVRGTLNRVQTIIGKTEDFIDLVKNFPDLVDDQLALLRRDCPGLSNGDTDNGYIATDELRRVEDFLLALVAQPQAFVPRSTSAQGTEHVLTRPIRVGETIDQMAAAYNVPVEDLVRVNDLQYPFVDPRPHPARQIAAAERLRVSAEAAVVLAQSQLDAFIAGGGSPTDRNGEALLAKLAQARRNLDTVDADIAAWRTELEGRSGILYAGDDIRIPQPRNTVVPSVIDVSPRLAESIAAVTGRSPDEEDRLFGLDLRLDDATGNLVWSESLRDLELERGLRHMANVQVRYVRLPLGALRYAPGIGNFAWEDLAQWQGPGTNKLLAFAMWQTLRQDPRVREIHNVTAETHAGIAYLNHSIELINGKSVPEVRIPIE